MAEEDESWQEFFDNNRLILPHPSKRPSEGQKQANNGFCLTIKNVDGVRLPQSLANIIEPKEVEFQLRITFFDTANKYFYGSTWLGPVVPPLKSENDRFIIETNEPLYFHSSLNDYTCVVAIEVVAFGKNSQGYSLGWTFIRMFHRLDNLRDISTPPIVQRQPVYNGSLGVLLYLPTLDGLEDYIDNQRIDGCFIGYSLQSHSFLDKVLHLLPENVLIGGDDIVPGISESNVDDSGMIDILRKPKLLKTFPCFVNKLSVYLEPSVDEFEEHLLQNLNQDRLHRSNISPDDGLMVTIIERRLRVGVHNGWTFVSKPHVVYLEPEYEGGGSKSGRRSPSPSSQGSLRAPASKIVCLVLRSRLELVELVYHPLFAVVFEIEYVVSEPFAQPLIDTKRKNGSLSGSLLRSSKQTFTVQFAVWTPFEEGSLEEKEITLNMDHGALMYPGMKMVYKAKKMPQEKKPGKINFSFTQQRKRTGNIKLSSSPHGSQLVSPMPSTANKLSASSLGGPSSPYSSLGDVRTAKPDQAVGSQLIPGIAGRPPLPGKNPLQQRLPQIQGYGDLRPSAPDPVPNLTEVPHSQYHTHLLLSNTTGLPSDTSTLSRAGHAQLSSAGFASIVDRHGNPPLLIDPTEIVPMKIDHEVTDSLQVNEIVIQFLAMSRCFGHRSVFFTFQFYRFPQITTERMYLKGSDSDNQGQLSILQRLGSNGAISNEAPGLVIRYLVDPAYMQEGETRVFSSYRLAQSMHLDVWDGDSLLLIGSASLELKHLLRQGREAVLVSHELDVTFQEYSESSPTMVGNITRNGAVHPVGIETSIKAKLHLRSANIGHHSEMPTTRLGTVPRKRSHVIMSETLRGNLNGLNTTVSSKAKSRAKLLAECDAELATVLFSRQGKVNKGDRTVNEMDAVRQRKLQRMQAVRQATGAESNSSIVLRKEEKLQRARDLKTIQLYRDKNKHEGILSLLAANITTNYTIYPSFGYAEFFEFAIKNPYDTDQTISIQCEDQELTVIKDAREWRYFKKYVQIFTPMEENMFNTENTEFAEVFLRPHECVHIPFKYQTFRADHSIPDQRPLCSMHQEPLTFKNLDSVQDNRLLSRSIKISFMMKDNRPLAILNLNIEPRPHAVNQTLRFYHPEQSFFKKLIRMPPRHSLPGAPVIDGEAPTSVHVRCSDINAVCEVKKVGPTEPQDVFVKVACGPSPTMKRLFVLMYLDTFMAIPSQTWQFFVHSLQRVDMMAVEGQTTKVSVILRGTQSSRLVRCYSSQPEELMVSPSDPVMLMANAVQEVTLSLTPLSSGGTRYMQVNVVDTEFHQLVRTWLVCASCQQPVISKAFELQLQVGGGKGSNKRVSFTNPYPTRKVFYLNCNRPDLLQFKDNKIEVGPGQPQHIGLKFAPQQVAGTQQLLIFINDAEGKNEETFSISAVYR